MILTEVFEVTELLPPLVGNYDRPTDQLIRRTYYGSNGSQASNYEQEIQKKITMVERDELRLVNNIFTI